MVNIRAKGQNGEREAIRVLTDWAAPVLTSLGLPQLELSRNLEQTRGGGYDLDGVPWLTIEVKRHENLQIGQWWKQAVNQAREGQIPFLMYRQNRTPWKFRLAIQGYHEGGGIRPQWVSYTVDMGHDEARRWFQTELWTRQQKG